VPALPSPATPASAIALLSITGFAQQSLVRVTDSLLPQIAAEFATTVGAAAIIVSAYTLMHGTVQLAAGPMIDRFGKYRAVTFAAGACALVVLLAGLSQSLSGLTLARLAAGLFAALVIPASMAFIGDVVPFERRQEALGRYLSGILLGQLFGQAAGGILGDLFGWRSVFFLLSAIFAAAFAGLLYQLMANPVTRQPPPAPGRPAGMVTQYRAVLRDGWARRVVLFGLVEAGLMLGLLPFIGADLRLRFGLTYTGIGAVLACFAIGGLVYAATVNRLIARLGQPAMARAGGLLLAAMLVVLAFQPVWWFAPAAVFVAGLAFLMLHGTLQTAATQMTPSARGTAVGLFSAAIYFGQTIAISVAAPIVDRFGAAPVFLAAAVILAATGALFARQLRREQGAAA
jgi:MFS transporter, YNFM family, putative membrane transport protein